MAEPLIPDPNAPTGTGPRQDAVRPGIDYRQIQAPEEPIQPWMIPNSGRQAEAEALSQAFKGFGKEAGEVGSQLAGIAGARAGAAAGAAGQPGYKTGFWQLSPYGAAYNNAATGAYLTESEIHADDLASQLRIKANDDPVVFQATYSAAADAAVKAAPPLAQAALRQMYNERLAAGVGALAGAQAENIKQEHKQIYDLGTERDISRVADLQGSANPADRDQATAEHQKLIMRINGGVDAGLYTPAEAQAKLVNATKEITAQVFEIQVDRELANMSNGSGSAGVISLLDQFRTMHESNLANPNEPAVFSENEFNQLMSNAKQKLMQENLLELYGRRDGKTAEELKFEAGDRSITVAMAQHADGPSLSKMVSDGVANGDIKPEVGRAVLASIQRGRDSPPNDRGLYEAENDPKRFDWSATDISVKIDRGEINAKQAIELTAKIEHDRNGWESHPPIRDAHTAVTTALKLPSGIALETATDEQKKEYAAANVELTRQLNMVPVEKRDAEAPRIANNVILGIQAKNAEADAASQLRGRTYLDTTYGPGGTRFKSNEDYAARLAHLNSLIKADQDKATQLRSQIRN